MSDRTTFSKIEVGHFFASYNNLLKLKLQDEWRFGNAINIDTGGLVRCGPDSPVKVIEKPNYRKATEKQLAYLRDLGVDLLSDQISFQAADRLISANQPSCHYCGMQATGIGFFGEHDCEECGG